MPVRRKPIVMRLSTALLLSAITGASGLKCLFMGHSFFTPISSTMAALAAEAGINHIHRVVFAGGQNGIPSALWNTNATREQGQSRRRGSNARRLPPSLPPSRSSFAPFRVSPLLQRILTVETLTYSG